MSKLLLDTNIILAFFKGNPAVVTTATIYVKRHKHLTYSIITHYELLWPLAATKNWLPIVLLPLNVR